MRYRRLAAPLLLLGAILGGGGTVLGQSLLQPNEWLPPGSDIGMAVSERPKLLLQVERQGGTASYLVRLGELAFRSSDILGGNARRAGLSCDACHPAGDANLHFFIPGLSRKPGTVDVSHALWNRAADDGLDNPISIPSLRGIGETAPYGFRGRFASLRDFTRRVIVTEFAGVEPPPALLDALVEFQTELAPAPNRLLQADGSLADRAGPAAQRGARLFAAHCARCHLPDGGFDDGRRHDVGSGGAVDTPSLRGVGFTPPYFHDGRYDTLAEAVAHFDRQLRLGLRATEAADLAAYLTAISGEPEIEPVTLSGDLARLSRFIELLRTPLLEEDATMAELVSRLLRGEVGRVDQRFQLPAHEAARSALAAWAQQLADIARLAEAGKFPAARAALDRLEQQLVDDRPLLAGAAPSSLYDKAVLRAALANRPIR